MSEEVMASKPWEDPDPNNTHKEVYEWIQCAVVALIFCVLVFVFFARVVEVSDPSMFPTLRKGDKVIVTRLDSEYRQGDIVVLRNESVREEPIVRRIIAVEGQTVAIDFENSVVTVDDAVLDEPYVYETTNDPWDFGEPVEVPEGCVFVMGDNRNNSIDSRDSRIDCVDTRSIMGKVVFRLMPFENIGAIYSWEY